MEMGILEVLFMKIWNPIINYQMVPLKIYDENDNESVIK